MKSKVVTLEEAQKHNRLDAGFYLTIKPEVEQFFREYAPVPPDYKKIVKLTVPLTKKKIDICNKLTGEEINYIHSLIAQYKEYRELKIYMGKLTKATESEL